MGIELFGLDIAEMVNDVMGDDLVQMTLIKDTIGSRDSDNLAAGQSKTTTSHICNGFTSSYKQKDIAGTTIRINDTKISILGASLSDGIFPVPGDRIITENNTYTIQEKGVSRDPAAAKYDCHVR